MPAQAGIHRGVGGVPLANSEQLHRAIRLIDTGCRLPYHGMEAVLDGELAVPCTRNPLQRG